MCNLCDRRRYASDSNNNNNNNNNNGDGQCTNSWERANVKEEKGQRRN